MLQWGREWFGMRLCCLHRFLLDLYQLIRKAVMRLLPWVTGYDQRR